MHSAVIEAIAQRPRAFRKRLEKLHAVRVDIDRERAFLVDGGVRPATLHGDTWILHLAVDGAPPADALEIVFVGTDAQRDQRRRAIDAIDRQWCAEVAKLHLVVGCFRPARPVARRSRVRRVRVRRVSRSTRRTTGPPASADAPPTSARRTSRLS